MSRQRPPVGTVRPPAAKPKGEVRIIGGQWKRSLLPVANLPGVRPTPDRVRETLFNWLGQDLTGWRCADIFAGSGALGFEAASRGAAHVLVVEQQSGLVQQLLSVVQRLGASAVKVERGDGVAALQRVAASSLDLVLIDPPFESTRYEAALQAAAAALRPAGFVYLEAPQLWTEDALNALGLKLHRHLKAGAVHAHLLQRIA